MKKLPTDLFLACYCKEEKSVEFQDLKQLLFVQYAKSHRWEECKEVQRDVECGEDGCASSTIVKNRNSSSAPRGSKTIQRFYLQTWANVIYRDQSLHHSTTHDLNVLKYIKRLHQPFPKIRRLPKYKGYRNPRKLYENAIMFVYNNNILNFIVIHKCLQHKNITLITLAYARS